MSDRRGRQRSDYDNGDYYDNRAYYHDGGYYSYDNRDDDYEPRSHHRPRPQPTRQRSLGRQALDKLQSAIGGLVSDNNNSKPTTHRARSCSRSRSSSRSRSRSRTRHHSRSPPQRRSSHHHSHRDDDRTRNRSRDRYYPPSASQRHRPRSRGRHDRRDRTSTSGTTTPGSSERSRSRWQRGIKAAMEAGAAEAFRLRKEPGAWTGAKGGRIATAALSAGVIRGVAADHGPGHHGGGDGGGGGGGKLGSLASAAGGMMVNRLVNGSRREVRR
ncbi:hypothetical protein F5144DRAFT_550903 [Chaetomium tenue]|uniref:Uncharacterized protein n=1 Tax=Chaetomium tenue TaxID=1854479 RepID=A0ACB7NY19_9PEZI|nr:hypothetical protein F5144DRAFT_550903 [Chaetomium globosum]